MIKGVTVVPMALPVGGAAKSASPAPTETDRWVELRIRILCRHTGEASACRTAAPPGRRGVHDRTQQTCCTPSPGHAGRSTHPQLPAILHSLQRVGTARPAAVPGAKTARPVSPRDGTDFSHLRTRTEKATICPGRTSGRHVHAPALHHSVHSSVFGGFFGAELAGPNAGLRLGVGRSRQSASLHRDPGPDPARSELAPGKCAPARGRIFHFLGLADGAAGT
jgi:hypothetical protein